MAASAGASQLANTVLPMNRTGGQWIRASESAVRVLAFGPARDADCAEHTLRSRGYVHVLFLASEAGAGHAQSDERQRVYWPPSRQLVSERQSPSPAAAGMVAAESSLPHWRLAARRQASVPVTQLSPGVYTTGRRSPCGHRTTTEAQDGGGLLVSQT